MRGKLTAKSKFKRRSNSPRVPYLFNDKLPSSSHFPSTTRGYWKKLTGIEYLQELSVWPDDFKIFGNFLESSQNSQQASQKCKKKYWAQIVIWKLKVPTSNHLQIPRKTHFETTYLCKNLSVKWSQKCCHFLGYFFRQEKPLVFQNVAKMLKKTRPIWSHWEL